MKTSTRFQALNAKTFEPMTDEKTLAASRCLAILATCIPATSAVRDTASGNKNEDAVLLALGEVVFALLEHGSTLDADLHVLAGALGCKLIAVPADSKEHN